LVQATAAAVYRLLADGHGSTRVLLDITNPALPTVAELYAYTAHGELIDLTGVANYVTSVAVAATSLLYSGEQTDLTGQQYLRGRYYDPGSGRFNRLDPFSGLVADPLSLHKYLYVHGDPINGFDPSGELFTDIIGAYATGIEFAVEAVNQGYDPARAFVYGVATDVAVGTATGLAFAGVFGEFAGAAQRLARRATDWVTDLVRRFGRSWEFDNSITRISRTLRASGRKGIVDYDPHFAARQMGLDPEKFASLPPLRQQYVTSVFGLRYHAQALRQAGMSSEEIARFLHAQRRTIGIRFKDVTPPEMLKKIYARNLEKYGDELGPNIEYLRGRGKSWEDIIESASRTGGEDLGF
jgi:RHS repeat-associated protein